MSVTTPNGPQLAVLPTAAEHETRPKAQILQPSGWPVPKGYANGMAAEGRIVVTGGVIGWDAEERLADGFVAQVRRPWVTSPRSWPRPAPGPSTSYA